MKLSIILAIKNEKLNIIKSIQSIINNNYNNIEFIIVDSSDSFKFQNYIKNFKFFNKIKYFYYKPKANNKRGSQINFGFQNSVGEIIFFPDADMILNKSLINEIIIYGKRLGLYCKERIKAKGVYKAVRNFERFFYTGTDVDAIRSVPRFYFKKINGFNENILFGPDDWDFTSRLKKIGLKTKISTNFLLHDETNLDFFKNIKKKIKYLDALVLFKSNFGNHTNLIYRSFGIFFENNKKRSYLFNNFHYYFILMFFRSITYFAYKFKKLQKT